MRKHYKSPDDFPEILPVFPLSGSLLLPRVVIPLNIFEPRYLKMIDDALASHKLIGMVQPHAGLGVHPDGKSILNQTACAGRITSYAETDDGRLLISLTGVSRFKIVHEIDTTTLIVRSQQIFIITKLIWYKITICSKKIAIAFWGLCGNI